MIAAKIDAAIIHDVAISAGGRGYHCGRANTHRHGAKFTTKSFNVRAANARADIGSLAIAA